MLILKHKPGNKVRFLKQKFQKLNYHDIKKISLHTQEISEHSSIIAKNNDVRKILKKFQLNFAKKNKNCCIEGRDISTKILPNSDVKFYFTCSLNIAAKRRFNELRKKNNKIKFNDVKKSLKIRNYRDKNRKNSPLIQPKDAVIVRTDKLKNIPGMIEKMSEIVDKKIKEKYGS